MAKSELLEKLKNNFAPYVRNAIIGYGNRIGNDAFYEGGVSGESNTYILNGEKVTVIAENDKNFFKVVDFVQNILKEEIGRSNKSDLKLDELIGEILHVLKYNSCSSERNLNNVPEHEILTHPDFQEAKDAFEQVEENLKELNESQIDGFEEVIENGEYGCLKNKIKSLENKLTNPNSNLSNLEKNAIRNEISNLKQKAMEMLNKFKQDANNVLNSDPENVKAVKARVKELLQIVKDSPKGSPEYENAMAEAKKIKAENKEIFASDRKIKKVNEELRELRQSMQKENVMNEEMQQMGA